MVNVTDSEKVQLVLNGFTIKCTTHSPIFIKSADKVFKIEEKFLTYY